MREPSCNTSAVKRILPGGYELDDDPDRIDREVIFRFLSEESYWAEGRSRADVEKSLDVSQRVIGCYGPNGEMVGFCRISSDEVVFAYLCDLFVLSKHRGRGLGEEIVREAIDRGRHRDLRWLLGTVDGHDFYRRFGFGKPSDRIMERPGPHFADI